MPAHAARTTGPGDRGILARRLTYLIQTTLIPVTDSEHELDIRKAGGDASITRRTRPMQYREVAERMSAIGESVDASMVSKLAKGERTNPTLRVLQALAEVFRVPTGFLTDANVSLEDLDASQAVTTQIIAERVDGLFRTFGPDEPVDGKYICFSEEDVAAQLGADPNEIKALRKGTMQLEDISLGLLDKLAKFFGLPLTYLIAGRDASDVVARVDQRLDMMRDSSGALVGALRRAYTHQLGQPEEQFLAKVLNAFFEMETRPK